MDLDERLRQYREFADGKGLLRQSEALPLVEAGLMREELECLEKVYGWRFGVVYESRFNTVVVDPVWMEGRIRPYERVVSTAGNGIVVVTMDGEGRFVLLRQFRHAPRKWQYGFPRGYAEKGVSEEESVKRELREELKAVLEEEPVKIGQVSPDSGLTSSQVGVWLARVKSFEVRKGHEGIGEVVVMTEEKIRRMAREKPGEFDDGFTMAALWLLEGWRKQE